MTIGRGAEEFPTYQRQGPGGSSSASLPAAASPTAQAAPPRAATATATAADIDTAEAETAARSTHNLDAPASESSCLGGLAVDIPDVGSIKDSASTSSATAERFGLLWPRRFEDSALEKEFVLHRLDFARRTTRIACGVLLVFFILLGFCPPPTGVSKDTRAAVLVMRCLALAVGAMGPLAAGRCDELGLCFCWLPICCSPLVFSCFRVYWAIGDTAPLAGTCGMSNLLSSEEYEESKSDSLLLILMLTTAGSFFHFTPVRCRVGWWLAVLPPIAYAFATFPLPSDGPECSLQRRIRVSLSFAVSCGFALLGRAWNECSERHSFLTQKTLKSEILSERVLRYQAQHQVSIAELSSNRAHRSRSTHGHSQRDNDIEVDGGDDDRSEGPPPSCTTTEYAFQSPDQVQLIALGMQEHWLLNGMNFHIDSTKVLGTGAFGKVYQGVFCGVRVAVKLVREDRARVDDALDGKSMLANEIRVLRRVRHPHIACFFGVYVAKSQEGLPTLALLLELVRGPSLQNFIEKEQSAVSDIACRHLLMDIAAALWYLHESQPHIIHSDLKATNILVEQHPDRSKAKLIDFGLSRVFSSRAKMSGGTLSWVPPEFFHTPRPPPVPSFDVFSFGRLAFFVITGRPPCCELLPSNIQECRRLVEECLSYEPMDRPTMATVHRALSKASL